MAGFVMQRYLGKRLLTMLGVAVALALPTAVAMAHPGVGIVRDRRGNVFFTDLVHVWRISPAGKKSIAVRAVHTHELAIDSLDNVYGEDNRYLGSGEGDDRYRHRIWRLSPDGRVTDVMPWRSGFWREYGFTHDHVRTMYWSKCPARRCTLYARAANASEPRVLTPPRRFTGSINWMAGSHAEAGVYVIDGPALRHVDPEGRVTTIAPRVGEQLMGLWSGPDGFVYVTSYASRAVIRVRSSDGQLVTVARSQAPWAPSGVLVAPDRSLWVLEYSTSNEARVRHIPVNGASTTY